MQFCVARRATLCCLPTATAHSLHSAITTMATSYASNQKLLKSLTEVQKVLPNAIWAGQPRQHDRSMKYHRDRGTQRDRERERKRGATGRYWHPRTKRKYVDICLYIVRHGSLQSLRNACATSAHPIRCQVWSLYKNTRMNTWNKARFKAAFEI